MIDNLIERLVKDKLKSDSLTDKITGFLVKKKRRGTYQALNESKEIEIEITNDIHQFMKEWLVNELLDGFIKKEFDKEIDSQLLLELTAKGYGKVSV